jgi:hypothetical protein
MPTPTPFLYMVFRKEHLARDIAKFRIYALHSNFASTLDRNEWIYALLRRKMHAAWPQCLLLAATEFQLTLDPVLGFSPYVDQALKIAARLQSQSTLSSDLSWSFSLKSKVSFQVLHKRAAPSVDNRVASSADEAGPSQPLPKLAKLSPLFRKRRRLSYTRTNAAIDVHGITGPRPTCTADSSAALTATAPVHSLVHAWPCSAPLQPLLPLPFPAPPCHFLCTSRIPSLAFLPHLFLPTRIPICFPDSAARLCPFWHIFCLDMGFEHLPLVRLPC